MMITLLIVPQIEPHFNKDIYFGYMSKQHFDGSLSTIAFSVIGS